MSEIAIAHFWRIFFLIYHSIMVAPRQIEHHLSVNLLHSSYKEVNRQRYPAKAMPSSPTVRSEAQASGLPSERPQWQMTHWTGFDVLTSNEKGLVQKSYDIHCANHREKSYKRRLSCLPEAVWRQKTLQWSKESGES